MSARSLSLVTRRNDPYGWSIAEAVVRSLPPGSTMDKLHHYRWIANSGIGNTLDDLCVVAEMTPDKLRDSSSTVEIIGAPQSVDWSHHVSIPFSAKTSDGSIATVIVCHDPRSLKPGAEMTKEIFDLASWHLDSVKDKIEQAKEFVKEKFPVRHQNSLLAILQEMVNAINLDDQAGYTEPGAFEGFESYQKWSKAQIPAEQIALKNLNTAATKLLGELERLGDAIDAGV